MERKSNVLGEYHRLILFFCEDHEGDENLDVTNTYLNNR